MGPDTDTTDELTSLLLDGLGPVLAVYRREVARRVGLTPDELLCLDRLQHHGPLPASALGTWLGVTRSGLSKILRRLEAAGHVRREVRRRGQEADVAWDPEPGRDAVLGDLRARVHRDLDDEVEQRRFLERRRREHAAMPDFRWWER